MKFPADSPPAVLHFSLFDRPRSRALSPAIGVAAAKFSQRSEAFAHGARNAPPSSPSGLTAPGTILSRYLSSV